MASAGVGHLSAATGDTREGWGLQQTSGCLCCAQINMGLAKRNTSNWPQACGSFGVYLRDQKEPEKSSQQGSL